MRLKKSRGYSSLQLILAITVLLVVVATLLAAFSRLLAEAEKVQVQATAMSLRAAVLGAHEVWLARGSNDPVLANFSDDHSLVMNEKGWPVGVIRRHGNGSLQATQSRKDVCEALWQTLLRSDSRWAGNQAQRQQSEKIYRVYASDGVCRFEFSDPHKRLDSPAVIEYFMADGCVNFTFR